MQENFWPNSLKELVSLFWNKNDLIVETESNKTLLDIFAAFFQPSWLGSRHDLLSCHEFVSNVRKKSLDFLRPGCVSFLTIRDKRDNKKYTTTFLIGNSYWWKWLQNFRMPKVNSGFEDSHRPDFRMGPTYSLNYISKNWYRSSRISFPQGGI